MDTDALNYRPDYDPEQGSELVYDSAGTPVTNNYLEQLADELERNEELHDGATVEFHLTGRALP